MSACRSIRHMKLMLKLTAKNFFVVSVGLHRFEADVKILGRLDAFVAKNPTHKFVVTGLVAQDNRCRRVPELVAVMRTPSCFSTAMRDGLPARWHTFRRKAECGRNCPN